MTSCNHEWERSIQIEETETRQNPSLPGQPHYTDTVTIVYLADRCKKCGMIINKKKWTEY